MRIKEFQRMSRGQFIYDACVREFYQQPEADWIKIEADLLGLGLSVVDLCLDANRQVILFMHA
jgi:hypothetical protein